MTAFPNFRFHGSASFFFGALSAFFGIWAVSWYLIYGPYVISVEGPPAEASVTQTAPVWDFAGEWGKWWYWAVLAFLGLCLLRFSYRNWLKSGSRNPWFVKTVKKLTSGFDETFGEGLSAVENLGAFDPTGLCALKEAVRQRGNHSDADFYLPGTVITDEETIAVSRSKILELAEKGTLLEKPQVTGKHIAQFLTMHEFKDIVDLAYAVKDVGGVQQAQAFQLIFNQIRLEAIHKNVNT